jgi:hypothetical protein
MSQFRVNNKPIITKLELLGLLVLFSLMLVFLFPKDKVTDLIEKESSNYDLSMVYLENLIRSYPENTHYKIMLANLYFKLGKFDKADTLLATLGDSIDKSTQLEVIIQKYFLHRDRYFAAKSGENLARVLALLQQIATLAPRIKASFLAEQAQLFSQSELFFSSWHHILNMDSTIDDTKIIKTFDMGLALKEETLAWNFLLYAMEKINTLSLIERAAIYQWNQGNYSDSASFYEDLMDKTHDKKDLKRHFFKLVQAYRLSKQDDYALATLKKGESIYLNNDETILEIVDIYLAMGYLDRAKQLSVKLLKERTP